MSIKVYVHVADEIRKLLGNIHFQLLAIINPPITYHWKTNWFKYLLLQSTYLCDSPLLDLFLLWIRTSSICWENVFFEWSNCFTNVREGSFVYLFICLRKYFMHCEKYAVKTPDKFYNISVQLRKQSSNATFCYFNRTFVVSTVKLWWYLLLCWENDVYCLVIWLHISYSELLQLERLMQLVHFLITGNYEVSGVVVKA